MSYTDSHIQTLYSVTNVSTHAVPCFHLCSMPGIGTIFSGTQAVATTRALGKIAKKAKFVFGPPTSLIHSSPTSSWSSPCPASQRHHAALWLSKAPPLSPLTQDCPFWKCPVIKIYLSISLPLKFLFLMISTKFR